MEGPAVPPEVPEAARFRCRHGTPEGRAVRLYPDEAHGDSTPPPHLVNDSGKVAGPVALGPRYGGYFGHPNRNRDLGPHPADAGLQQPRKNVDPAGHHHNRRVRTAAPGFQGLRRTT